MSNHPRRTLGSSNVTISPIGLGCMGMSEFVDQADAAKSGRLIHHALDACMNFFDTADVYGPWTNERLLGVALQDRRDEAVIATKFGLVRDDQGRFVGVDGSPEYVKQACEGSLERLGVETIDLYYQHRVAPDTPIEETVGAMADLVREGKVRFLGLSAVTADQIRQAHAVHPITAVQSEYSMWSGDAQGGGEVLDTCKELGITFVAYSPLGQGFLTGAITSPDDFAEGDIRRTRGRFQSENIQKNLDLVEVVRAMAAKKEITPAQLALAWLLHQGDHIVTIPGTTKEHRFDENQGANDVELSAEELAYLEENLPGAVGLDMY